MSKEKKQDAEVAPEQPVEEEVVSEERGPLGKAWDEAQGKGKSEHLNIIIVGWQKSGQIVLGRFVKAEPLAESKFGTVVQRYILETDAGLVSCVLGATADKELLPKLAVGDLLRIHYQGKRELGDGRSVNVFDIQRAPAS
ncbi:unnamed protein product [marine sediment metagenome]|uniref:OB domain-containing protein n=1 Tax=marine sediment metagenome TaxID=412755 RepID=X1JUY4_9ZZZZ